MCVSGRENCERPTTRQDGQCKPCADALRRAEKKMAAHYADIDNEDLMWREQMSLREDLCAIGIM